MINLNNVKVTLFVLPVSLLLASCAFFDTKSANHLPIKPLLVEPLAEASATPAGAKHGANLLVLNYTGQNYHKSAQAFVNVKHQNEHYLIPERFDSTYPHDELAIFERIGATQQSRTTNQRHWQGKQVLTQHAIGVALVNQPRCQATSRPQVYSMDKKQSRDESSTQPCFYPDFDHEQIQLLIQLSLQILQNNPDISPTAVVGLQDILVTEQLGPGPRFPWYLLYQWGIGAWYEQDVVDRYWQQFKQKKPSISLLQQALSAYGYAISHSAEFDQQSQNVINAFQNHFMPWHLSAKPDVITCATVFALLDKYFPEQAQQLLAKYQRENPTVIDKSSIGRNSSGKKFTVKRGQLSQQFPQDNRSTRKLVNDRGVFKAYQQRGEIIIDNESALSADIYVNGQKLSIADPLQPHNRYRYRLNKRTQQGKNSLKVENVLPQGSQLTVTIPYPKLAQDSLENSLDFSAVDALINQDIEQGFPGAVLLVQQHGEIIKHQAYGYAQKYTDAGALLATPVKMTTKTLFDLASNTKMFATNFALMKLVSEGKLDVNLPISVYLPKYVGNGREFRTVKDMLTHQSGYAPQVGFHTPTNALGEHFYSQSPEKTKALMLSQVPFVVTRKNQHIYSDSDYILLGMLVEKITGLSLDSYVEHYIYQPLGLSHILFNPLKKGWHKNQFAATEIQGNTRGGRIAFNNIRQHVLQGEVHDEKAYYSLGGVAGHAGLFARADNMAVLAQVLLNRGGYGELQLFDANVLEQFIKPNDKNSSLGYGWRRASQRDRAWHFGPYASDSAFGHTGWTGTVTVIDPEHDLAIILLTNARHSKIVGNHKSYHFLGKQFETGQYGSVISLVYEAVLAKK